MTMKTLVVLLILLLLCWFGVVAVFAFPFHHHCVLLNILGFICSLHVVHECRADGATQLTL